jgi:hypothetical protein
MSNIWELWYLGQIKDVKLWYPDFVAMPMHSNSRKYGIARDHILWQHHVQQFQLTDRHYSLPVTEENN